MRAGRGRGVPSSFSPRAATARTRESWSSDPVVLEGGSRHEQHSTATGSHNKGVQLFLLTSDLVLLKRQNLMDYWLLVTGSTVGFTVHSQLSSVNGGAVEGCGLSGAPRWDRQRVDWRLPLGSGGDERG